MGVLNHAEQAVLLTDTVDCPRSIKDMMPAVLRVDLSKHEQLNVVLLKSVIDFQRRTYESYRRSTKSSVLFNQVLHVGLVETKPSLFVMFLESGQGTALIGKDVDYDERVSSTMSEHGIEGWWRKAEEFCHAIMQNVPETQIFLSLETILELDMDDSTSFDAVNGLEIADEGDAGSFRAPRGNVSGADIDIDGILVVAC